MKRTLNIEKVKKGDRCMIQKVGISILICFLCTGCFTKKEGGNKTSYDKMTLNTLLLNYIDTIEQEIAIAHIEGEETPYNGTYHLKKGTLTNEEGVSLDIYIKSTDEKSVIFKIEDYKVIYAKLKLYTSIAIYENGEIRNE